MGGPWQIFVLLGVAAVAFVAAGRAAADRDWLYASVLFVLGVAAFAYPFVAP